ncbi:hypothetical protein [Clostridium tagluense]|nr:hypothetical protein [Clostridium tagluense]
MIIEYIKLLMYFCLALCGVRTINKATEISFQIKLISIDISFKKRK